MSATPMLKRLLEVASGPALPTPPAAGALPAALIALLEERNGFSAFESSLHIFPSSARNADILTVEAWNDSTSWRSEYRDLVEGHIFFALDIFADQFSIRDDKIWHFGSETAAFELVAETIEDWARYVLDDPESVTGYPAARAWQAKHGTLQAGHRLFAKTPFVLGGTYEQSNLYADDATAGLRSRGCIARQIHDLPDGTSVRLEVT